MKKIEALIRPFWLDKVRDKLTEIGVHEMVVTDVRSSAAPKDKEDKSYLAEDYIIEFVPRIKIEVLADKPKDKKIIDALKKIAESSENNDIKILVSDVEVV